MFLLLVFVYEKINTYNEWKRDLVPLVDAINTSRFAQNAKDYIFLVNVLKLYKFVVFFLFWYPICDVGT